MAALKNKKMLIILTISTLLLCVLIGVGIYFSTLPKIEEWNEPINTEVLLPEPDSVAFYCDNRKYVLTEAAQAMVYETISGWLSNVQSCAHEQVERAWQISALRFEFYYQGPYRYVGSLGTEEPLAEEPFVYSAIAVGGGSVSTVITPYIDGEYFGIDDTRTSLSLDIDQYAWDDLIVKALLGIPHEAVNTEAVESNVFPAKPDSIIVYHDGQATELVGEELEAAYGKFVQMTENSIVSLNRGYGFPGYAPPKMLKGTCIELRYNQRQKCVSDREYNASEGTARIDAYYNNKAYDALLFFLFDEGSYSHLELAMYRGDSYDFFGLAKEPWDYDDAAYADLKQYIATLLE